MLWCISRLVSHTVTSALLLLLLLWEDGGIVDRGLLSPAPGLSGVGMVMGMYEDGGGVDEGGTSGVYIDNSLDQTVLVRRFNRREKRVMKEEILTLLGLHRRPRPRSHSHTAAPSFMLGLYKRLKNEELEEHQYHTYTVDSPTSGKYTSTVHGATGAGADEGGSAAEGGGGVAGGGNYIPPSHPWQPESSRSTVASVDHSLIPGMNEIAAQADMITSFVNQANRHKRLRHKTHRYLYYDFSEVDNNQGVIAAELRVYKEPVDSLEHLNYTLVVYRLAYRTNSIEELLYDDVLATQTVSGQYGGWIHLNVTKAAIMWDQWAQSNVGLYITVKGPYDNDLDPADIGVVSGLGHSENQPFLVAFFEEIEVKRTRKRRAVDFDDPDPYPYTNYDPEEEAEEEDERDEDEDVMTVKMPGYEPQEIHTHELRPEHKKPIKVKKLRSKKGRRRHKKKKQRQSRRGSMMGDQPVWRDMVRGQTCQRHTLYISFERLGWQEWLIAPDGYAAYYCGGDCPFPLNVNMNATNHAIVQTLVNLHTQVPRATCAPTTLSSVSVLYFDDNQNVILKKYKNMVVEACGCH